MYMAMFKEKLFLEDEKSTISLETMYVPPRIKGTKDLASDYIKSWYKESSSSCLLVFGDAGIGKSSVVSKIVYDSYNLAHPTNSEYCFANDEVLAVSLRNYKECFSDLDDDFSSIDIVLKLFSAQNRNQLKNKILIIDGLDEITVLVLSFSKDRATRFIEELNNPKNGLKILITSRPGYFELDENARRKVESVSLIWTEDEVDNWCRLYGNYKPEFKEKCDCYKEQYRKLPKKCDDRRYEILCIPFIMYIVCNSGIDLNSNISVGQIYYDSFRSILIRIYNNENQLLENKNEKKLRLILWQYTKEIAYQMHFIMDLNLIDDETSNDKRAIGFRNAQDRTIQILREKLYQESDTSITEIDKSILTLSKYLAIFHFAESDGVNAVSFVHKSVYEYFTAVKLYEDYFAKFSTEYFENSNRNKELRQQVMIEVMETWIEAFRYTVITPEIFKYLSEMERPAFSGNYSETLYPEKIDEKKKFNKELFLDALAEGMEKDILSQIAINSAVKQYLVTDDIINPLRYIHQQFSLAFYNLTWFLTGLGYRNKTNYTTSFDYIVRTTNNTDTGYNFNSWFFDEGDFEDTNLFAAIFKNAKLEKAIFNYSVLHYADFSNAILTNTGFINAKMNHSQFIKSKLNNADFTGAKLEYSSFKYSDLTSAELLDSNLSNAYIRLAKLHRTNLSGSNLDHACLNFASLIDSNLTGTNLSYADFTDAYISGADFSEAILIGADFSTANILNNKWDNAMYCTEPDNMTKFPYGFNPKDKGMIEVDKEGNIL